jgi:hypothetical protein
LARLRAPCRTGVLGADDLMAVAGAPIGLICLRCFGSPTVRLTAGRVGVGLLLPPGKSQDSVVCARVWVRPAARRYRGCGGSCRRVLVRLPPRPVMRRCRAVAGERGRGEALQPAWVAERPAELVLGLGVRGAGGRGGRATGASPGLGSDVHGRRLTGFAARLPRPGRPPRPGARSGTACVGPVPDAFRPGVTVGQRDADDGRVQHDHQLGGRDGQQCHAKAAAVAPGAGTLHTDTPERFAGPPGAPAGSWTIGAADAFAPAPLVTGRIGGVA